MSTEHEPTDSPVGWVAKHIKAYVDSNGVTGRRYSGVDDVWFSELQGVEPLEPATAAQGDDRATLRARRDTIEQRMRAYLAALQDETLHTQPIQEPEEDRALRVWQVLLHVVNHGTDHP